MGRIIAVVNQKGGVGKTTTSINLASAVAVLGKRVLLIDLDPQGNASSGLGFQPTLGEPTIYQVLIGKATLEQAIAPSEIDGLFVVPANAQLSGAEVELVGTIARETHLKRALAKAREQFDIIFIDCPPSMGLLTINALTATDGALVPLQCEYYALEGLSHLMETVRLIQSSLNSGLILEGILLTMFDARNNLAHQVVSDVRAHFDSKVYKTVIPRNVRLSEAPSHAKSIITYEPNSKGAKAYLALGKELLGLGARAKINKPKGIKTKKVREDSRTQV